jgi:hypothetical protein
MQRSLFFALALPFAAWSQSTRPPAPTGEWEKKQLTPHFWAEGAHFADFNKDGKNDIVYGPYWFEGPEFTERHTYADDGKTSKIKKSDGGWETIPGFKGALSNENEYADKFLIYTHDFSADGWPDILVFGFPGKETWWFENPQGRDEKWKQHVALDVTDNESPHFTDITGDGRPEIVCSSGGFLGYATYDPKRPSAKWSWRNISPKGAWQRFTHGMGVGDVNGDGRKDFIEANGWWEQPASLAGDPVWTRHEAQFGQGGAQMFAYDVNGDGRNDIITSLAAHEYGVAWFEQTDDGGVMGWNRHLIVGSKPGEGETDVVFSQPHATDLADMNGDGLKDIITGKRFWAHGPGGDPEPGAPPVLWWFELQRDGKEAKWVPHFIDAESGVGTQVLAADLNSDRKVDLLVGNKRGAFVFLRR